MRSEHTPSSQTQKAHLFNQLTTALAKEQPAVVDEAEQDRYTCACGAGNTRINPRVDGPVSQMGGKPALPVVQPAISG